MKITDVRAVQPPTPDSPPDWRTQMGQILVAVDTDSGLTGYGVGGGGAAGIHVVRTVLRDALLGQPAENVEQLAEQMYLATLPFGRKGLAIMAASGVDLALWDLRGKAAGRPVAELLGGRVGEPIPTYATLTGPLDEALRRGYRAFKIACWALDGETGIDDIVRHAENVRATIGPDRELMIDAFMRWDVPTALEVAEALRPLDMAWLEEPLLPDDWEGYAQLSGRCALPIAGGEHEYMAASFAQLVERNLHQVLQPDVCWCGGLTELVKIYHLANEAGVRVCPHRGSEPWALHAIAALDRRPLAESGRPWMYWVGGGPEVIDGYVTLDDRPGFGVEIDEGVWE